MSDLIPNDNRETEPVDIPLVDANGQPLTLPPKDDEPSETYDGRHEDTVGGIIEALLE